MNLREHDDHDGMKVWLSEAEVTQLLDAAADTERRIGLALGARCGLRSKEWLDVTPRHVVDTDAGTMLRVPSGKGDKYRETPMPSSLATTIRTVADVRDDGPGDPILSVSSTRSLRRWVDDTAEELAAETEDSGWLELTTHDLRRTWATHLADADVDPLHALDWGGWADLQTFLEHYKGAYSPAATRRAREKVEWLA
jgi:integrase